MQMKNCNEVSPYTCQNGSPQKSTNHKCGKAWEEKETLITVGGNVNCTVTVEKEYGNSSKN